MENERDLISGIYGNRDELPFDIQVYHELRIEELTDIFYRESDFLHYIGHIDSEGFECVDGKLDAAELDETNVFAFLLNACTSYEQGINLIKAGSAGGVVTLQDVINSGAERIGKSLAKLLNQGFPLSVALRIARDQSIMGGHYLVIGDGDLDIAQPDSLMPTLFSIEDANGGYLVEQISYPNRECGIGTLAQPFFDDVNEYYLASGGIGPFHIERKAELTNLFKGGEVPLRVNGELVWSSELDPNLLHT